MLDFKESKTNLFRMGWALLEWQFDSLAAFEEFHRKTRYIHFGQFEIFEI